MEELYFIGTDIVEETRTLVNETIKECTNGMTENELRAYKYGVQNTLNALIAVVCTEYENEFVVHINGIECPTEFDIDDLMLYLNQENINGTY